MCESANAPCALPVLALMAQAVMMAGIRFAFRARFSRSCHAIIRRRGCLGAD